MGEPIAHSCGGSHGFGPYWVRLTVFPINLLGVRHRRTVTADDNGAVEFVNNKSTVKR